MSKEMHVFGGFKTIHGAHAAAEQLGDAGVPHDSISVLVSDKSRAHLATVDKHTKAPEGAAAGGIAGGILGGLIAGLTTVAALAMPGVGILAAGPVVAIFAGAGAGAATGGTIGGLVGLGMSQHEVKLYSDMLKSDGVLVVVTAPDKHVRDLAKKVFEEFGAITVETHRGPTAQL